MTIKPDTTRQMDALLEKIADTTDELEMLVEEGCDTDDAAFAKHRLEETQQAYAALLAGLDAS